MTKLINRLGVASLAALLLLTGCDKPRPPAAQSSQHLAAAASDNASSTAPAAPAGPVAPADLARRLLAGPFSLEGVGFTDDTPLSCDSNPGAGDAWTVRCRAQAHDGARGGQPAMIEIDLFDHDVDLAVISQPLVDHIKSLGQEWQLNNTPDITTTNRTTGVKTTLPVTCRQALGRANSPAYCELMGAPRIMILAGVKPRAASTDHLSMGEGNAEDPSNSNQDTDHAADLAIIALAQVTSRM